MNTNPLIHHRLDTTAHRGERRATGLNEARVITRKALERWENEGGRIPELPAENAREPLTGAERF